MKLRVETVKKRIIKIKRLWTGKTPRRELKMVQMRKMTTIREIKRKTKT
jgi:hypothetical protein